MRRASGWRRTGWADTLPLLPVAIALTLSASSVGCDSYGAEAALSAIRPAAIDARLRFLASDHLRGRAPGTRGGAVAARYIASQFAAIGLEPPVGDGGYLQEVPLDVATPSSRLSFRAPGGAALSPNPGQDLVVWTTAAVDSLSIDGELVFVGRGLAALPDGRDDYEGVDVTGDLLLLLTDELGGAYGPDATLVHSRAVKRRLAEAWRSGAAGVLFVHLRDELGYDWEAMRASAAGERLYLREWSDEPARLTGWLSEESAREIAGIAGLEFATLLASARAATFRPMATGIEVTGSIENRIRAGVASNVAGLLPGGDAGRADEVILITGHYDGLGLGPAVEGDSIYNGAYDNASGVALLLNLAEAFARLPRRPARSILFLAPTASEAGLLGTRHYLQQPLRPLERTVAVLNLDGANLWGATRDAVLVDEGRTDLRSFAEPAARAEGLRLVEPAGRPISSLYASDHAAFVQAGVPAALVAHGLELVGRMPGSGEELLIDFISQRYHHPDDEYRPEIDYAGALQQGRLALRLGVALANSDRRPTLAEVAQRDRDGRAGSERGRDR